MQKVAYFKDGNKNIVYEIVDKQARDDIEAMPKHIIDKVTSPFTSSGNIVQCHPVEGYPLDVAVNLEPVQEGSGDPYPAGGGKNLLKNTATTKTVNGVTFTVNADGSVTVKGTATATAQLIVGKYNLPHGDYIINGGTPNASCYTYLSTANGTVYKDSRGKDVAFTLSGDAQGDTVMLQVVSGTTVDATVYPMIRLASITDATYAPYSNIRPISGHTGVEVVRTGKNLLPKVISRTQEKNGITLTSYGDGSYRVHGTCTANGTALSFSTESTIVVPKGAYWHLLNDGTCTNAAFVPKLTDNTTGSLAFSVDNRIYAVSDKHVGKTIKEIGVYVANGETLDITFRPMMRLDDALAPFEPYQGETYPVTLSETVYGGTVRVSEGETVSEWGVKTLTGDENVVAQDANKPWLFYVGAASNGISANISNSKESYICSHFKYSQSVFSTNGTGFCVNYLGIYMAYTGITTVEEMKTFLAEQYAAGTPVQVAYKLTTPTTLTTDAHDIPALKGTNTVYADAGEVTVNGRIDPEYLNNNLLERIAALEAAALNN